MVSQRPAGTSGLALSTLGLGAWQFSSGGADDYWGLEFTQELAILSRVRHRNVVNFVGAVTEQPNLCVVMEFMEEGSLNDLLHKQKVTLALPRTLRLASDVAQGCQYLHRQVSQ